MEEKTLQPSKGEWALLINLLLLAAGLFLMTVSHLGAVGLLFFLGAVAMVFGYFTVRQGTPKLLLKAGAYRGTVARAGFYWALPYLAKQSVDVKTRAYTSPKLHINDNRGHAVVLSVSVQWRVAKPAASYFSTSDPAGCVQGQAGNALRKIVQGLPFEGEEGGMSLQQNTYRVAKLFEKELGQQLASFGLEVQEAHILELAYAPESAWAMSLQRYLPQLAAAREALARQAVSLAGALLAESESAGLLPPPGGTDHAAAYLKILAALCSQPLPLPAPEGKAQTLV